MVDMPCSKCSYEMDYVGDCTTTFRGLADQLMWFENYKCRKCGWEFNHDITPRDMTVLEENRYE